MKVLSPLGNLTTIVLLILAIILVILVSGCTTYNERFTYLDPTTGHTNHVVHVSHRTFLVWGKAAELKTETQTMEFIRTVNATGLEFKTDSEAIKAMGAAVGQAAGEILKKQYNPIP